MPAQKNPSENAKAKRSYRIFCGGGLLATLLILLASKLNLLQPQIIPFFRMLVSVSLATSVTVLMFDFLKSQAKKILKTKTKSANGTVFESRLELSGPIVSMAVLIPLFYRLSASSIDQMVAVRVHKLNSIAEHPIAGFGYVTIVLSDREFKQQIDNNGYALFPHIPIQYFGAEAEFLLDAKGFEIASTNAQRQLVSEHINLSVKRLPVTAVGAVKDIQTREPIAKARVTVEQREVLSTLDGHFEVMIEAMPSSGQENLHLKVSAVGYMPYEGEYVPESNPIVILLRKNETNK